MMRLLLKRILYKRKKWYVVRKRYKRKYKMTFREIKAMWDKINNTQYKNNEYTAALRNAANALTYILITNQKSFRIYYFDDNDVFDMIKIIEQIRRRNYGHDSTICYKFINDLRITNSELYLKYRLLF